MTELVRTTPAPLPQKFEHLDKIRVLTPWTKATFTYTWKNKVQLSGFFGLPDGVKVDSVQVGHLLLVGHGATGRIVHPGVAVVVTLESESAKPVSLSGAKLVYEDVEETPVEKPEVIPKKLPERGIHSHIVDFRVLQFAGGVAHAMVTPPALSTLEEIWCEGCVLSKLQVGELHYEAHALKEWRGVVVLPNQPIQMWFLPKKEAYEVRPRAVVRLEKLSFPKRMPHQPANKRNGESI